MVLDIHPTISILYSSPLYLRCFAMTSPCVAWCFPNARSFVEDLDEDGLRGQPSGVPPALALSLSLSLSESNMSKEFPNNFPTISHIIPYHSRFSLLTFLTFYVTCHFSMVFPPFFPHFNGFLSLGQATLGIAATSEGQRPTEVGRCLLCRRQREMVRSAPPTHHLFWLVKWVCFKTLSKLAGSNVIFPFILGYFIIPTDELHDFSEG